MGKKSSDAPKAPDPIATATAQQGMNLGTAISQQAMNNVNQYTPYGNLTYKQNGNYTMTDPLTGKPTQVPMWTSTQTLSPQQQALMKSQNSAALTGSKLANEQLDKLGGILGKTVNINKAPKVSLPSLGQVGAAPNLNTSFAGGGNIATSIAGAGGIQNGIAGAGAIQKGVASAGAIQNGIAGAGAIQKGIAGAGGIQKGIAGAGSIQKGVANSGNIGTTFGDAGAVTRSYGDEAGYAKGRQSVEDALMARMNPSLEQERSRLSSQLANQGIKQGTEAYDRAMANYGQRANDARYGAILNAGQEQSRLAGLDQNRAQFQNSAQAQAYDQALGRGSFANSAQAQQYSQNANNMQLGNAAQAQLYGQNANNAQFANAAQAQQYGQNANNAQFANAAQAQQYGQNANNAEFANSAQAQLYGQNANNMQLGNAAQAQQYSQNANNAEFANSAQAQQFGQNAAQGAFGNAAQAQKFGQNAQLAAFGNDAMQQGYANKLAGTGFNNQAAQQQFGNQQSMQSNWLQQQYAAQNQPLNQIGALLGTGQVQNPSFQGSQGNQVANTDYAGLVQNNYQNQMAQWQQQQNNNPMNGIMGGLFGLGSSAIMASDRRLKTDVSFLGWLRDLPIWSYRYIWGGPMQVGVMAQDMLQLRPEAVVVMPNGFLAVDYGRL